ncbi:MAG: hypothetical protein ACKVU2_14740 [Saprospiraceae bacterium]
MKRVLLIDIQDMTSLSWVLDQSLFLIANSDTPVRGSELCRLVNLHPCELTRMKLAHSNPTYQKVTCRRVLFNLLRYLFQHFPGLVVWKKQNGQLVVRMTKLEKCKASCLEMEWLPKVALPKRHPAKPGSTRWYLNNGSDN